MSKIGWVHDASLCAALRACLPACLPCLLLVRLLLVLTCLQQQLLLAQADDSGKHIYLPDTEFSLMRLCAVQQGGQEEWIWTSWAGVSLKVCTCARVSAT